MFIFGKKTVSALVALLMVLSMLAVFVLPAAAMQAAGGTVVGDGLYDATSYPDITRYSSGIKVYSVKDRAGMEKLAELVNVESNPLNGVTIYQIADIDMEGVPFVGIGYGEFSKPFSGTFDGNGFTIDNLFVVRTAQNNVGGVGLFGAARNAVFKNIGISGGLIVGDGWVGSVAGRAASCKFSNCWNAATVVGQETRGVGGIAGSNANGNSSLANCYNVGLIYCGSAKASGIVGWINYKSDKVVSCYNAGEIVCGVAEYDPTSLEGHIYAPIVCQAVNQERGLENANNFYILGRGGAQTSYYELIQSGVTVLPGTETALSGCHDGAVGVDACYLEDGTLAAELNAGFAPEGKLADYEIAFENVPGVGYPVLTYRKDGAVVAQRYAKDNTNVNGDKTWENASSFFAYLKKNAYTGGANLMSTVSLTNADDVYLFGVLTYGATMARYKITEVKLRSDVDMEARTVHNALKYGVSLGITNPFDGIFDGQYHVIKNWKSYGILLGNSCAGFISLCGNAVVKNLGMVNAESYYDGNTVWSQGYIYPSLLVERATTDTLTMENCFATGTLICDGVSNANSYGGIFSTTWQDNLKITNCWSQVSVRESGGELTPVRTVGRLPSSYDYTGDVLNVLILSANNYGTITSGNVASEFQTLAPTQDATTRASAYWLGETTGTLYRMDEEGDVSFATAETAVRKLTVRKLIKIGLIAEEKEYFYHPGERVTLTSVAGYALDVDTLPAGGSTTGFDMPAADVTVDYYAETGDYTAAQQLLAEYSRYDAALFKEELAVEKIVADAEAILALKNAEQTESVKEAVTEATAALLEYESGLTLTLKNEYPYVVRASELELYASFHNGVDYGVASYEDWNLLVKMVNGGDDFSGKTIHLLQDVEMGDRNVTPMGNSASQTFSGVVDGHNHVFKNLKVEYTADFSHRWVGLIGRANNATVRNLGIESGSIMALGLGEASVEILVGAFMGEGFSCGIYNCWNAASVDSGSHSFACASGIARLTGESHTDFIFNVGEIRSQSSAGGLSAYSQGKTTYYNSFSAGKIEGDSRYSGAVRYNSSNLELLYDNVYSAGHLWDGAHSHANEQDIELDYADYENGKIAWLLNQNYIAGAGGVRTWYTNDFVAKTIRFGTEANQTQKVTLVAGENRLEHYVPRGSVVSLKYPATGTITYALSEDDTTGSLLNGSELIVGNGDVTVNVAFSGVDLFDSPPYVSLSDVLGKHGKTTEVPIVLGNLNGCTEATLKVLYDPAVLSPQSVVSEDTALQVTMSDPVNVGELAAVELSLVHPTGLSSNAMTVYLMFSVGQSALKGDSALRVELNHTVLEQGSIQNESDEGKVTIGCGFEAVTISDDVRPEAASHYGICVCGETTAAVLCSESTGWQYVTMEPTCSENGSVSANCAVCGYSFRDTLAAPGHNLVVHSSKAPTCTEIGWEAYEACTDCDYTTYREIPAEGHDLIPFRAKDSTCTEVGWEAYEECTVCDYTTYREIPPKGHDVMRYNAKAPTCTEVGWEAYVSCVDCDYTTYQELPAKGHTLIQHDAKTPTCTEIGWEAYENCTVCDYTTYREIPANGHDLILFRAKEPTCTEVGWEAYEECTVCNYTTYQEIPAKGHASVQHSSKAPTCTEIGWVAYETCVDCDYTTYQELPAKGHTVVWHNSKAPTCTEKGWAAYETCNDCDYTTYQEFLPKGHVLKYYEGKAPTCTKIGWEAYEECSVCGYNTYQQLSPTGHTLNFVEAAEATYDVSGNHAHYLCHCGAAFKDAEGKIPTTVEAEMIPQKTFIRGDVNNDGSVTVSDVVCILRIAAGHTDLPAGILYRAADVTDIGDTEEMQINTADAALILQYLVGKINEI